MKRSIIVILLGSFIFLLSSCKTEEKASAERRNLMMPKKSELRRNSKYVPHKPVKTYSTSKKRKKNKR